MFQALPNQQQPLPISQMSPPIALFHPSKTYHLPSLASNFQARTSTKLCEQIVSDPCPATVTPAELGFRV